MPDDLSILILPTQAIGKSNEHLKSPGTLTLSWDTAVRAWTEIGESVHRAGLRKLIMVNSHGGNVDCISIVARELRVRLGLLAIATQWSRLGRPAGLYTDLEQAVGIHAGDIETSLMLHFRPDLVRMDKAANFEPATVAISKDSTSCARPGSRRSPGWRRICTPGGGGRCLARHGRERSADGGVPGG